MKERPILFSGEMVRAILDGRKTQTRRVVKPQPPNWAWTRVKEYAEIRGLTQQVGKIEYWIKPCPYGQPGDRLWVRETWRAEELPVYGEDGIRYRADNHFQIIENTFEASEKWGDAYRPGMKWRSSIFMPRWASRITLEIVSVRVDQVQDISEDDAKAEGITLQFPTRSVPHRVGGDVWTYPNAYARLWDDINSKSGLGWDANPWVWVVEFRVRRVR